MFCGNPAWWVSRLLPISTRTGDNLEPKWHFYSIVNYKSIKPNIKLSFGGINSLFPPGGIPSPMRLVSPHTRTRRAPHECGSMLFKACFPPAPQVLRISMIGTNALTGAICCKSVVHRLHNLPPGPPGALCQRRVATVCVCVCLCACVFLLRFV